MKIEDVINVCGQLPQTPQNLPIGNNTDNGTTLIGLILAAGVGFVIYRLWKERKDSENNIQIIATSDSETLE